MEVGTEVGSRANRFDARAVAERVQNRDHVTPLDGVLARHPDCDVGASRAGALNKAPRAVEARRSTRKVWAGAPVAGRVRRQDLAGRRVGGSKQLREGLPVEGV